MKLKLIHKNNKFIERLSNNLIFSYLLLLGKKNNKYLLLNSL